MITLQVFHPNTLRWVRIRIKLCGCNSLSTLINIDLGNLQVIFLLLAISLLFALKKFTVALVCVKSKQKFEIVVVELHEIYLIE